MITNNIHFDYIILGNFTRRHHYHQIMFTTWSSLNLSLFLSFFLSLSLSVSFSFSLFRSLSLSLSPGRSLACYLSLTSTTLAMPSKLHQVSTLRWYQTLLVSEHWRVHMQMSMKTTDLTSSNLKFMGSKIFFCSLN